jgi:hypothetical protein
VVSYDAVRFPVAASVGANAVAERFGLNSTLARAASVAERSGMEGSGWVICDESEDASTLLKDGSLTVTRSGCSGAPTVLPNFATQVRLVEGSGDFEAPRTFFVRRDGTVWGWGDTLCGLLGNGESVRKYKATPVQLPGLKDVTSIAIGSWFAVARDSTGAVWTWGINYIGELGLGQSPPGSVPCTNDYTVPQFRFNSAVLAPTRIPTLSDIMTVAADRVTGYALDRSGSLFRWGLIPTGYNFAAPEPYFGEYLTQTVPAKVAGLPPVVAIASSYYMAMALTADGKLWGFGPNVIGNFGDGTLNPHLAPAQVPGISGVVEIAGIKESPFVALLQDGTIRYWGGCCTAKDQTIPAFIRKTPTAPVPGSTPFYSAAAGSSLARHAAADSPHPREWRPDLAVRGRWQVLPVSQEPERAGIRRASRRSGRAPAASTAPAGWRNADGGRVLQREPRPLFRHLGSGRTSQSRRRQDTHALEPHRVELQGFRRCAGRQLPGVPLLHPAGERRLAFLRTRHRRVQCHRRVQSHVPARRPGVHAGGAADTRRMSGRDAERVSRVQRPQRREPPVHDRPRDPRPDGGEAMAGGGRRAGSGRDVRAAVARASR